MKKIVLVLVAILTISLIGNGTMLYLLSKKEVKIVTKEIKVPKEVIVEKKVPQNDDEITNYATPALQYITVSKTGKSTDNYIDRLSKIKNDMSENIYKRLVPDIGSEDPNEVQKEAGVTDKTKITTTRVSKKDYTYKKKDTNKYEIDVLYTLHSSIQGRNSDQRYLSRMDVSKEGTKYLITNIYEDSMLSNGVY